MAEDDVRVGDGRGRSAAAVARRAGRGAGALRTDPERSRRLGDVRDRAAARADARDVHRGRTHGELADVRLARDLRPTGHAHGDVRRGASHVEGQNSIEPGMGRDERRAADAACWPGQNRLNWVLARRLEAHETAVRAHHVDRRADVGGRERVAHVRQVLLERRSNIRVHQRRHGPLVLAELGEHLGRDRHRQVGSNCGGDLGDEALVVPIRVGVQQADGERLDAVRDELLYRTANGGFVDRRDDRAVGAGPLGHFANVARVGQRLGLFVDHEAEQRSRRPGLGEMEDVPEPLGDDQADERAAALEDSIGRDGRAVEDGVEIAKADVRTCRCEADAFDHADGLVLGRARRLRQPDALPRAVVQHDIRKGPADVDAEPVRHPAPCVTAGSRYFATRTSQDLAWPSKFSIRDWRAQISPIATLASSSHSWKVTVFRNLPTHSPPV